MLDIADLMQTDADGRGVINILAADKLYNSPKLYSTFLLWMLAELFEQLPEVGDVDKPKLVFFFDEAHLLFNDAPKALLEKIEQVVRLIRSKGVGVYFVTQNPLDVPETVLGQLGNRVQHALRAFTPRDQKAVKTAAETMRANPEFDAATVITELGVGEALISFLDEKAAPTSSSAPPSSPPTPASARSPRPNARPPSRLGDLRALRRVVDRESAFEKLRAEPPPASRQPGRRRRRRSAGRRRRPARRPQQHPLRHHRPPRRAPPRPGRTGRPQRGAHRRLQHRTRDRARRARLHPRRRQRQPRR
jgi:hypothetical protein